MAGRAPSPSSLTSLSPAEERAASAEALEAQLLLSADLTLRAGQDGATVLVHRGVLCVHSRVFSELLNATPADDIALSGRTKADLELLVSWLYRCENITQARRRGASFQLVGCRTLRCTCAPAAALSYRHARLREHAATC